MERAQIFDLMGELRLYGMKAAFDTFYSGTLRVSLDLKADAQVVAA
jgi:hypothetical protein